MNQGHAHRSKNVKNKKMHNKLATPPAEVGETEISFPHEIFGPPALVSGEEPAAYEELRARISAAVKPKDFLEEIWLRDVVDLTWDSLRMRRMKASLLSSGRFEALDGLMRPVLGFKGAESLSKELAAGESAAFDQANGHLSKMGLDMDDILARALAMRIDQFERIDRMIMNAEGRRNAALREVDRHRSSLAQALREASDEAIDAEFDDVPPQQQALLDAA
jgi:hypothetical protein